MSFEGAFEERRWSDLAPRGLVILASITVVTGLFVAPERTWLNLLLNGFYLLSLGLSATFFIASQLLSGARWSASLRRVPEALMTVLPIAAILMIVIFAGRTSIYPWATAATQAHEASEGGREQYLRPAFVIVRMVLALACWVFFSLAFRKTSLAQDANLAGSLDLHRKLVRYAAVFLLLFAPTFTLASYDWISSLDPHWFTTMFAVYTFAGMFAQGIAAVTVTVVILREHGELSVHTRQLHDLGKLLFAFSTFWAYIWLCQYLLIWYGNIPEEITFYVARTNGRWLVLFALDVIVNWLVPFIALMSASAKKSPRRLLAVAIVVLFGHWLDLYVLIMPFRRTVPELGPLEILIPLGYASLAYLLARRALARAPLVPVNDPILAADRLRQAHGHS